MPDAIRVRFAPSPTGMFHVGGARSALFNWALARQGGGRFVLRIEDTDAERNRPKWVEGIISALAAIGISSDDPAFEGPYFQSHSAVVQREASLRLFADGRAYYCDCTREDLAGWTGAQQRGYDGYCRDRGLPYELGRAMRFRIPDTGSTIVDDVVRGRTEFPNNAMEDFIIARGDGTPPPAGLREQATPMYQTEQTPTTSNPVGLILRRTGRTQTVSTRTEADS